MSDDVRHEVDQLLRDREKYEAWLQRLDSEKPAKAGPAFDKVRNDYKQRLQEVLTKLQSHGESLQSRFRSLEAAITDLESCSRHGTPPIPSALSDRTIAASGSRRLGETNRRLPPAANG